MLFNFQKPVVARFLQLTLNLAYLQAERNSDRFSSQLLFKQRETRTASRASCYSISFLLKQVIVFNLETFGFQNLKLSGIDVQLFEWKRAKRV